MVTTMVNKPRVNSTAEIICKKCTKDVKNYVTCHKCKSTFHPSCILKISGLYVSEIGEIFCCDDITSKKCNCEEKEIEIQNLRARLSSLNEICFENSINHQPEIINDNENSSVVDTQEKCFEDMEQLTSCTHCVRYQLKIQYMKNEIALKTKMTNQLEERIDEQKHLIRLITATNRNPVEVSQGNENQNKSKHDDETSKTISTVRLSVPTTSHGKNLRINVTKDNNTKAPSGGNIKKGNMLTSSEEEKTNRKPYKTRRIDVIKGTGTENCSLQSANKKAWLHLGKINKDCKEEDVVELIKAKFPENKTEIVVEKISREDSTSASFRLGIDFDLLEEVNRGDFWPRGVIVKRYFFRKYRRQAEH